MEQQPAIRADSTVAAAVAAALRSGSPSPLIDAAALIVAASIRAAELYPDWAKSVCDASRWPNLDELAQHLVASNSQPLPAPSR